ncbi:putative bifunctional diguanylate cyclase/phosphodiesterase [Aureliella helgolandensis]|uniref:Cyclic di-GMP phosphodiesterase Gmr n=1 Tax=Aureliella helgolandensis TaxID=2527968 RepID=A0A518G8D5_9BACT|nr:GGDEF and EAL domain-containing protein [Aureliella helgolandensis]QDV24846.1 Cyclic di-GMP phosphodiesterase Gmr [Aureliella helgolandensis]
MQFSGLDDRNQRMLVLSTSHSACRDIAALLSLQLDSGARHSRVFSWLQGREFSAGKCDATLDTGSLVDGGLHYLQRAQQEGHPYSIVFVDLEDVDHLSRSERQTLHELRTHSSDILVVLCADANERQRENLHGMFQTGNPGLVLTKPWDRHDLYQVLLAWALKTRESNKVSEQLQADELMRRQLKAFQCAVSAAGIVAVTDVTGKILEVNDNFCKLSGYARHELIAQNHRMLKSHQHSRTFFRRMYATIGQGKIWHGEICNRAKDGSLYWLDTTIAPMLDENGKPHSYFALQVDISERKRLEAQLHELAYTDTLTGLPNRDAILRSLQVTIDRQDDKEFALLFLDFDRFKLVNDCLGHEVGDQLLKAISVLLRQTLKTAAPPNSHAQAARLGGDEFVVLIQNLSNLEDVHGVANRLLEAFSQGYNLGNHTVYSTASIGIATNKNHYRFASEMLRDADLAMYGAKAGGKANYIVFDTALREKAEARLRIEHELRGAIAREEFALEYQPIISLETGKLEGVEALVRWNHPVRGLVGPDEFIPIAEETELIGLIGNWVLNEACRQMAEWRHALAATAPPNMHVKVSRRQLLQPNLAAIVQDNLARHSILPASLHLELAESMIMQERETSIARIRALKSLGIKIDIDDFGTGYSSLSCLNEFPIDVLKIDRKFVASINRSQNFGALLHAIVSLAANLNLEVVAEGIEDFDQLTLIQALGCEYGQGFLFSKPLPADQLEAFARELHPAEFMAVDAWCPAAPMDFSCIPTNTPFHSGVPQ